MRINLSLSGKQIAAVIALALGFVLAVSTTVAAGGGAAVPMNAEALAQTIVSQSDHVTAGELAQWLIEKRDDYQLIDIRDPWQYDDYHIPTAVNIPLSELFQRSGLNQVKRGRKVVIYGLGAGHAAQAQLMLALKGYSAYSLKEGISAWWEDVMTPRSLWDEDQDPTGYRRAKQIRSHFMGGPASSQAAGSATPAAAPAPPPAKPKRKPATRKKLKLGRGCG